MVKKVGLIVIVGVAGVAAIYALTRPEPTPVERLSEAAQEAGDALSDAADDLTQISGVGPVSVKKLHALGVTTFAQIAAWTPDDVAAMDEKLNFKGRIDRDDWLKQAAELAKAKLRIDSRKWKVARMAPRKYGDKQQIDHTSSDDTFKPTVVKLVAEYDKGRD